MLFQQMKIKLGSGLPASQEEQRGDGAEQDILKL